MLLNCDLVSGVRRILIIKFRFVNKFKNSSGMPGFVSSSAADPISTFHAVSVQHGFLQQCLESRTAGDQLLAPGLIVRKLNQLHSREAHSAGKFASGN